MAKSTDKAADLNQREGRRGRNRFASSPRPTRVILPARPPREVDNEIVSILLGGDPKALAPQAQLDVHAEPPVVEIATVEIATAERQAETPELNSSYGLPQVNSGAVELPSEGSADEIQASPAPPPSMRRERERTRATAAPQLPHLKVGEVSISTFKEFADRWRHGLRKGQLKICEVLYQKTHAVGQVECLTSFSELARLSGLKMRQCFNIIAQLESLGFIERARSQPSSNKKDQGSVVRFYLHPKK